MRLGSITLIPRPKSRLCNGSTLALPLLRKRVSSAGKVKTSVFWDSQSLIMVDNLQEGGPINGAYHADKLCILSRRTEVAGSGDCEEKKRKMD